MGIFLLACSFAVLAIVTVILFLILTAGFELNLFYVVLASFLLVALGIAGIVLLSKAYNEQIDNLR